MSSVGAWHPPPSIGVDREAGGCAHQCAAGEDRGPSELPEVGFLSAGTANVAARAFGLGTRARSVALALPTAGSTPVDVGVVRHGGGDRAFLLWLGAGWDAVVIHTLNASRTGLMGMSGLAAHLPRILAAVARYPEPAIRATVAGAPFGVFSSVIAANVSEIGLGGRIADGVDPADGVLDVVGVPASSLVMSLRLAVRMMTSSLATGLGVRSTSGASLTLEADGEVPFQLDGEPVGVLPAAVTVRPGAVRLLRT